MFIPPYSWPCRGNCLFSYYLLLQLKGALWLFIHCLEKWMALWGKDDLKARALYLKSYLASQWGTRTGQKILSSSNQGVSNKRHTKTLLLISSNDWKRNLVEHLTNSVKLTKGQTYTIQGGRLATARLYIAAFSHILETLIRQKDLGKWCLTSAIHPKSCF